MSRSRKKHAITGNCSSSGMKEFKVSEHRRYRRKVVQAVHDEDFDDLPDPELFGDEWSLPRDGKHYCPGELDLLRK